MENDLKARLVRAVKEKSETVAKDFAKKERESKILSAFNELKEAVTNIVFPKSFEISNQRKDVKINNLKDLDGLEVKIKDPVTKMEVSGEVKAEIKGDISLKKPTWYKEYDDTVLIKSFLEGIKWLNEQTKAKLQAVNLDRHTKASNALAVKIYDGNGKIVNSFGGQTVIASPTGGGAPPNVLTKYDWSLGLPLYKGQNVNATAVDTDTDWTITKYIWSGSNLENTIVKTGSWTNRVNLFI
jgi:hypothetical protein